MSEIIDIQGKRVDSVGSKMRQMEIALTNAQLANAQIWQTLKNTIAQVQIQSQVIKLAFEKTGVDIEKVFDEYQELQKQASEKAQAKPEPVPTDPEDKPV